MKPDGYLGRKTSRFVWKRIVILHGRGSRTPLVTLRLLRGSVVRFACMIVLAFASGPVAHGQSLSDPGPDELVNQEVASAYLRGRDRGAAATLLAEDPLSVRAIVLLTSG